MRRPHLAWYLGEVPEPARVLLVDAGQTHDIFDVVEVTEGLVRVRTAFLFELGEELDIRVVKNGSSSEIRTRVRAHAGTGDDKITELEVL